MSDRRKMTWWTKLVLEIGDKRVYGAYPDSPPTQVVHAPLNRIISTIGGRQRTLRWLAGRSRPLKGRPGYLEVMRTRGLWPEEIKYLVDATMSRRRMQPSKPLAIDRVDTPFFSFLVKR
jgi:hypothetical protein